MRALFRLHPRHAHMDADKASDSAAHAANIEKPKVKPPKFRVKKPYVQNSLTP